MLEKVGDLFLSTVNRNILNKIKESIQKTKGDLCHPNQDGHLPTGHQILFNLQGSWERGVEPTLLFHRRLSTIPGIDMVRNICQFIVPSSLAFQDQN